MNSELKEMITNEFLNAKKHLKNKDHQKAFSGFERVHVLGQRNVYWHTVAHVYMLKIGIETRDFSEIIGQVIRIPLGILGSLIGSVPTGNTGGSNIGLFKKMKIPKDLERYLD